MNGLLQLSILEFRIRIACVCYTKDKSIDCREEGPPASTVDVAVQHAYADGWIHVPNFGSYCPECAAKNLTAVKR